jgi:hypothetical protein
MLGDLINSFRTALPWYQAHQCLEIVDSAWFLALPGLSESAGMKQRKNSYYRINTYRFRLYQRLGLAWLAVIIFEYEYSISKKCTCSAVQEFK